MFKKIFSFFLLFALTVVHANAASHNGLKEAFDDLNYSLTVDWDQEDAAFFATRMKEFSAKLKELRAQGMTNEDLIAFAKTQIKDQKVAEDLEGAFSIASASNMTNAEATNYVADAISRSYSKGASWDGSSTVAIVLTVVLLSILGAVAYVGYFGYVKKDEKTVTAVFKLMGFKRPELIAKMFVGEDDE